MRQRRRAERSHVRAAPTGEQPTRADVERRRQRLLLTGVVVAVAFLVVFLVIGFYVSNYRPPRQTVAQVGSVEIKLGEVAPLSRLLFFRQAIPSSEVSAFADLAAQLLVRNEVVRQTAPELGVGISPGEVEFALVQAFEPISDDPSEPTPVVLSSQGEEEYGLFRDILGLGDAQYRQFVEGDLLWSAVLQRHDALTPANMEQVYLHWIVVASPSQATTIRERLDAGEEFAALATELNQETAFADEQGEVGWVPRGIFTELDDAIFALEPGEYLGPLSISLGAVIAQVSQGPQEVELTPGIRSVLVEQERALWYQRQVLELLVSYTLDEKAYDWVAGEFG